MGELQAHHETVRRTEGIAMSLPADAQHLFEVGEGRLADQELPGIGAGLVDDRRRLAPDELGAAGAEALVAAKGKLIGPAVEGAVAPFHRLHAQRVAHGEWAEADRTKKGREVFLEAKPQPQTLRFGANVVETVKLEVARHVSCCRPLPGSCGGSTSRPADCATRRGPHGPTPVSSDACR